MSVDPVEDEPLAWAKAGVMNKGEDSSGAPARARDRGGVEGEAYITGAAVKATAQVKRRGSSRGRGAPQPPPAPLALRGAPRQKRAMLHINDLTYRLGERLLIDKATAALPTGAHVGLVGRNGAGKTTLFRLICGEISGESGSISIPKGLRVGSVEQEAPD